MTDTGGQTATPATATPLARLITQFPGANPDLGDLTDPDTVREQCFEVSQRFTDACAAAGIEAEVVSGMLFGEDPAFPGVTLMLHGHAAALVRGWHTAPHDDTDAPPVVGSNEWFDEPEDVVVDWTARQFDPDAPVPLVEPLGVWRQRWRLTAPPAQTG